MKRRPVCLMLLVFCFGSLAFSQNAKAQSSWFQWHNILTQWGRNWYIYNAAQSVPDGAYGGQCKVWVQNVVWSASRGTVWLPQNSPYCDWQWNWSPDVEVVAIDAWNGVPMYSGQIIQAQVRANFWPFTSPHTMIVAWADANYISVIECNYSNPLRVGRRTVTWADFRRSVLHYTLYNVR